MKRKKKKTEEPSIEMSMSAYELDVVVTALMTRMHHLVSLQEDGPTHPSVGAQLACLDALSERISMLQSTLEAREALPDMMAGIEAYLKEHK